MLTDPEHDNEQMMRLNVGYWAEQWPIKLQTSTFTFKDHEYQVEPMLSDAQRKCVMKATQGGFTESEVLDSLHGMIFKHLPQGVLYLFPTTDDVGEFSKSRFNPLILANRGAIGKFVKSQGKGTDTASLKKIHDAFLYLRGARLSQKISDMNESSKLRGIPVDRVVFDEVDLMDSEVIAKARGRMGHSRIQQERYLSNPVVPGEGIDEIFGLSDQRYWFRKCQHCNQKTCAELYFMEDPEKCVGIRKDGTGFISCRNCGKEVFIRDGTWEPQVKTNSDYMHGYQWSQLSSVFNDPKDILHDFREPPKRNLGDVYRLKLGLPFIDASERLTREEVLSCCGLDGTSFKHSGPCAMGIDVGITKHVIIGVRTSSEQYQIVKFAEFSGLSAWDEIHDLARRFNVKSAVVDIRPDMDIVKLFQQNESYRVWLCEYSDNPAFIRRWDTKAKTVKDYRTALFDETHRIVSTPGLLTIPRRCPELDEFVKQMSDPFKVLETNKRTGARAYRYKGKNDHYRNAFNYFILAASNNRIATVSRYKKKRQLVANNTG